MAGIPGLSEKEMLILEALIAGGEKYGLELVEESGGELKRGTVYVTLSRMEEKGFVTARREERPSVEGGLPRRLYKPTGYGQQILRAWKRAQLRHELAFGGAV